MAYELPALPYAKDALAPHISEETFPEPNYLNLLHRSDDACRNETLKFLLKYVALMHLLHKVKQVIHKPLIILLNNINKIDYDKKDK
jgi:superoxide dismutase